MQLWMCIHPNGVVFNEWPPDLQGVLKAMPLPQIQLCDVLLGWVRNFP